MNNLNNRQKEIIEIICKNNKEAIIVGSIGTISYDLKEIEHKNKILIKGAMGAAIGCGFGIALNTDKQVVVIIGDGSILMKLGCISTVVKHNLDNLMVYILNNNSYKSCGGQETNFKYIEDFINDLPHFEVIDL